jgi:predicted DNA-binding transcriptional regulator YafY
MNKHEERLLRMHQKLSQSKNGVNRNQLTMFIFNAPKGLNKEDENAFCKSKRTEFFKLLKALRTGNYNINKKTQQSTIKGCKIDYDPLTDSYCYASETEKPNFNNLEEDEIMALPILLGVLFNYQYISIFDKLYLELTEKYCINRNDENDYVHNNIAITAAIKDFNGEEVVDNVYALHKSIQESKRVKFKYEPVSQVYEIKDIDVYPIQILFHEGLFYLWAINDVNTDKIQNFRIDRICDEIHVETDDNFNSIYQRKRLNIEKKLKHIVGVVPPEKDIEPITIKIKFYDWAAAYVSSAPIHHSWKSEGLNKKDKSVTGSIRVYKSFEVDFLLGRFRDYCEILEPKNYVINLRKDLKK